MAKSVKEVVLQALKEFENLSDEKAALKLKQMKINQQYVEELFI